METFIKEYIDYYDFICPPLSETEIKIVYDLFHDGIIADNLSVNCMNCYGIYFNCVASKNNTLFKKYFKMAIKADDANAMYNLGHYYSSGHEYNENQMLKYIKMAIEKGHTKAMKKLAYYYYVKNNFDLMLKYYLMAITRETTDETLLRAYQYYLDKDYNNMVKYYLMAVNKGNPHAMFCLGTYYYAIKDKHKMVKYYIMGFEHGDELSKEILDNYAQTESSYFITKKLMNIMVQRNKQINKLKSKIVKLNDDITDLKYKPDGIGYEEAKKEFEGIAKQKLDDQMN